MLLCEVGDSGSVRRINMSPLQAKFTPNLHRLVRIITAYGFKIRIVGGAVRDVLIGRPPRDIDMITDAVPDAVMYILGKHDMNYITKGIPHGTVKIRFADDEEYEITSLGYEVEDDCCRKSVVIHSGESWEGDARRRDFTVDTLSVTLDGLLYDYVDGMADLRNQYVRFLGSPAERIQKDPVLILRFFKLLSLFRDPKYDKSLLPLIKQKMPLIKKLKKKRIDQELENISKGPSGDKARQLMTSLGFDQVNEKIKESRLNEVIAYHGTTKGFTEFDPTLTGDIGMHFGTPEQANTVVRNRWKQTPEYEEGANVRPVNLALKNPLRVYDNFSTLRARFIARAKRWSLDTRGFRMTQEERTELYKWAKIAGAARRKAGGDFSIALLPQHANLNNVYKDASKHFWEIIQTSALRQGYDGFVYNNRAEGNGDSYVVFDRKLIRPHFGAESRKKTD